MNLTINQRLWIWVVLFLAFGLAGVGLVVRDQPILQTNLLALLPETERNPLAEQAIAQLSGFSENRVVFLIGAPDAEQSLVAARTFVSTLRQSEQFAHVTLDVSAANVDVLRSWIGTHRFQIVPEVDRQNLASASQSEAWLVQRVQSMLVSPFSGPTALSLDKDPLGFSRAWFDRLPIRTVKLLPQQGVLMAHGDGQAWTFVHASLQGSAYDPVFAEHLVAATKQAEQAVAPQRVLRAGAVFHAEAARSKAQADVDLIGIGSLLGMLVLLYWVFRSTKPLIAALLSVGFGILAACVVCVGVYGHLHLITLVFGASLIGEAVDYAVQYFAAHLDAGPSWKPLEQLHRMAPGLTVALGTSLLGYGVLWFSPFIALSQIALFAMVGLFAAWLSVFLFLPWWMRRPVRAAFTHRAVFQKRWLALWQNKVTVRVGLVLSVTLFLISASGWLHLEGRDDVRLLIELDPGLSAQEAQIKALTGVDSSSQFFLIEGQTADQVLQREESLCNALAQLQVQGGLRAYQAVSTFVPSQAAQNQAQQLWAGVLSSPANRLSNALSHVGFQDQVALTLRADFERQTQHLVDVAQWIEHPVSAPWRHLWLGKTSRGYASVVIPTGLAASVNPSDLAQAHQGVSWVDKPASVSRLFHDYRQYSALWLLVALSVVFGLLVLRYGVRNAGAVILPTVLALSFALGAYGWLGHHLTLFNMMALMLVLGVGVNYAIFLVEGGAKSAITFAGVQLSAATTLLSFGLLAFSSMPMLSGFGLMLTLGVACAVLLSPLALSLSKVRKAEFPCV